MAELTIWKFPLRPTDVQSVEMPFGAELLSVAAQFETICIWARVDPAAPKVTRTFAIIGTGHPAPGIEGKCLGMVMLSGGALIFHVFEQTKVGTA